MNIRLINYTVYPFHGYGGAELYVYNYAKTLVKNGHNVEIVCNSYKDNTVRSAMFSNIKYTFIGKPFYGKFEKHDHQDAYIRKKYTKSRVISFLNRFIFWVGLARLQYKHPTKFVHAFSDCGFIYTFFTRLFLIATIFDIENRGLKKLGLWALFVPIKKFYYSATTSRIIKKSQIVTSGGEDNTNELVDIFGCDRKKIRFLSNALEKKHFEHSKNINNKTFTDKSINLISIGRLEKLKNPLLLLEVFEILVKENKYSFKLKIIGDGPLKDDVTEKMNKINLYQPNSINLLSNVTEEVKMNILNNSDLYINLAETRYMLLVVMEAMACSLPIYTSYPLDGIVKEKVNGTIFNSQNPNKIAARILEFINENDIMSMGKESFNIIKKYTWENAAMEGKKIYSIVDTHNNE